LDSLKNRKKKLNPRTRNQFLSVVISCFFWRIMKNRIIYTLAIGLSLTGVYALYSVVMQAIIVVPIRAEEPVAEDDYSDPQRPAENVRVAQSYIAHREWAASSSYMLRAEQAFIYTQHWEPVQENNKRVRFDKFAMAWVSTDKDGQEQAVSIVSDHALIEFAFAFDEKAPNPGRVVRAILEGDVEIAGPDGLSVIGKNFIFDETELKLYTRHPVNFKFQSHHGSASWMAMKLIPAEGLPGKDRPHVYGVESIHLMANLSLPKNQHIILEGQMPKGDQPKPVKVRCAGELEFSLITNTAVFTDDVIVWTGSEKLYDRLDCYRLTLQFAPKPPIADDVVATESPGSEEETRRQKEYQQVERDLEFRWLLAESRFEAEGRQGQLVRVTSKSQNVTADMGRLSYDAETRILTMSSNEVKPGSKEREPLVHIVQKGMELSVPVIEAEFSDSTADRVNLSSFVCRGAGLLRYFDDKTGNLAFVATWKDQLSKTTDPETKLDLIELKENAHFGNGQETMGLIADLIKIWIVPFAISPTSGADGLARSALPEPRRLLAQRGVALKSPQLRIKRTNELDIRFEEPEESVIQSDGRKSRSNLRLASLTQPESDQPGLARLTGKTGSSSVGVPPSDPASVTWNGMKVPAKPIVVSADQIGVRMRLVTGKQEPDVLAVRSTGKVDISMERVAGERPTTLQGDRVDLDNETPNHEVIHVFGNPAKIGDQKLKIEGREIHLHRGENWARVAGPGAMQIPIPQMAQLSMIEGNAGRDLSVRWQESMNFDGLQAKFVGRVGAKAGLASMDCEQMELSLMERLSFQTTTADVKPAIHMIHCYHKVKFMNATRSGKILIDKYRGEVGEFTWNHATGSVIAQGPGEIQVWRRKKTGGSPFSQKDAAQANWPISVEITEWDYTRVQFEGKLKGQVNTELNGAFDPTIEDRVKVTHGPVRSPTDVVDPDDLPSRSGTIHCDRLQFVNHPVSEKNPVEYRELIILGNAEVEGHVDGRRFTASADEINFDGSSGLYVLRGHGKQNAILTEVGSGSLPGRMILFNPLTNFYQVDRATGGQYSQMR
jgi:lipopolysaccharide export system protein LptA/predicted Rdx family selenoprotein